MPSSRVSSGIDSWVRQAKPTTNYNRDSILRVGGDRYAYVWIKSPVPRGWNVVSATLYVTSAETDSGSTTVTAARVTSTWQAGRITWNNKPSATGAASDTKSSAPSGGKWALDVTAHLQAAADGAGWFGWRLDASVPHSLRGFGAATGKPLLVVTYTAAPDAPADLRPAGSVVSVAAPIVRSRFEDEAGDTTLASVQVQVSTTSSFATTAFDTGEIAASTTTVDLAALGWEGLANGATGWWRTRHRDGSGLWSQWSDGVSWTRKTKGTLTLTSPGAAPADYVEEFTPPIAWTFTGRTQAQCRVTIVAEDAPTVLLWDSKRITSTENSVTVPSGVLVSNERYKVRVQVWDTEDREDIPGDPSYVEASQSFEVRFDPTLDGPINLTASRTTTRPGVALAWERATMPDGWVIERNGKVVDVIDNPEDLVTTPGHYAWQDYAPGAGSSHTYRVRAVRSGTTSNDALSPTVSFTLSGTNGVWLGDPASDVWVRLSVADLSGLTMPSDRTVYRTSGSRAPVVATTGLYGREGTITGILADRADGYSRKAGLKALKAIREQPSKAFRLVAAETNMRVTVDVSWTEAAEFSQANPRTLVTMTVMQVADFGFDNPL